VACWLKCIKANVNKPASRKPYCGNAWMHLASELGKAFTKGFEDNWPKAEMSRLIPGLIKMEQIFSDQKKNAGR